MKNLYLFLIFSSIFFSCSKKIEVDTIVINAIIYTANDSLQKAEAFAIKNGKIIFKGDGKLKRGIYTLMGQDKKSYLDFFIDESTQILELRSDETENYLKGVVAINSKLENDFYLYIKETDRRNGTDFTKIFPEIAYFYENAGKYYEEARAKWEEDQKSAEPVAHVEEIDNSIDDAEG